MRLRSLFCPLRPRVTAAGLALLALVPAALAAGTGAGDETAPPNDPLADLGYSVTSGAASGYVDDAACALCHAEIAESYNSSVAMARAFYRPEANPFIEDFDAGPWRHPASGRHYQMVHSGDQLLFRRWTETEDGQKTHLFEQPVDWIMGSGKHSRVYIYGTPNGELYQLPIAWYTQEGRWGMAPGFDRPDHLGVTRRVRRECMFCHNGYPDVPAGSDLYGPYQTFPTELPEGLGCQRCHGPGAEHARLALLGEADEATVRSAIVNPGRLSAERRNDVCYECHMLPSVAMPGVRSFDRGDYSFRPGQDLAEYRVRIDPVEAGRDRSERFEINHHPYRLEQSTCFKESKGQLSCLTCHDPHRTVPPAERAAHYRAACLGCHEPDACALNEMAAVDLPDALKNVAPDDCVTCHMQPRRTEDVVHVVMTDHLIRRTPADPAELLAPREETTPPLVGVTLAEPERAPTGALGEVYRAVAVLRTGASSTTAMDHLVASLARLPDHGRSLVEPWFDVAKGQLTLHRPEAAEATLRGLLARPAGPGELNDDARDLAREWLGLALSGQGDMAGAEAELRPLLERQPQRPELWFNLGRIILGRDRPEDAVPLFRHAIELRPNLEAAWFHLGRALARLDRGDEAAEALRRALAIDPSDQRAARALQKLSPPDDAAPGPEDSATDGTASETETARSQAGTRR